MKPTLNIQLGQHLSLAPQLQQAIRLLQLSATELTEEIQTLLESNPMVEVDEKTSAQESENANDARLTPEEPAPTVVAQQQDYLSSNDINAESQPYNGTSSSRHYDGEEGSGLDNIGTGQPTLREYLLWQMRLTPLTQGESIIATAIIDAINEDGYLRASVDELVACVEDEV